MKGDLELERKHLVHVCHSKFTFSFTDLEYYESVLLSVPWKWSTGINSMLKIRTMQIKYKTSKHRLYFYHYLLRESFSDQWSLSDSKSLQVTRTLLSILAVLNNVVVWMVSARPLISKSPRHFNNPLVTVPKVPITISIIVVFMFHSFFLIS